MERESKLDKLSNGQRKFINDNLAKARTATSEEESWQYTQEMFRVLPVEMVNLCLVEARELHRIRFETQNQKWVIISEQLSEWRKKYPENNEKPCADLIALVTRRFSK